MSLSAPAPLSARARRGGLRGAQRLLGDLLVCGLADASDEHEPGDGERTDDHHGGRCERGEPRDPRCAGTQRVRLRVPRLVGDCAGVCFAQVGGDDRSPRLEARQEVLGRPRGGSRVEPVE